MTKLEEIELHWKQEKEAKPLLYVIQEEEIDYLLSEVKRLQTMLDEAFIRELTYKGGRDG